MAEASVARYVSMLIDMVENVTMRFNNSYAFSQDEASDSTTMKWAITLRSFQVKIIHENRDVLDLGANLTGAFPLTHPPRNQQAPTRRSPLEMWPLNNTTDLHPSNHDLLLE